MLAISEGDQRRAFSNWLRIGRSPSARRATGIELKFDSWHDLQGDLFTFVSAGRHCDGGARLVAEMPRSDHSDCKLKIRQAALIFKTVANCLSSKLTAMFLIVILGATDERSPGGFAPLALGPAPTLLWLFRLAPLPDAALTGGGGRGLYLHRGED